MIGVVVPRHGWETYLGHGLLSIVAMMLLGVESIRDVILFPQLRPEHS